MGARKQLEFSARSIAHIESIKLEIASDNSGAAEKVVRSIFAAADHLEIFPMLGHIGRRAGTREIVTPHYPYFISYRLTSKKVIVLAVIHQSRKYP